jgi:hypothetical protein
VELLKRLIFMARKAYLRETSEITKAEVLPDLPVSVRSTYG